MARIPEYTRTVTKGRAIPRLVDEGAINRAGQGARAVAKGADIVGQMFEAHAVAQETTALNEASVSQRKDILIATEEARKQNADNPFGFAERLAPELEKINEKYAQTLPTRRSKQAFLESSKKQNEQYFEQNFRWENQRSAQVYAERTEEAAQTINDTAFLAGQQGASLDEILNDVDATTVSIGTYQPSADVLRKSNEKMREGAIISHLRGRAMTDPMGAYQMLDSGAYDKDLGAEKSAKFKQDMAKQVIQGAEPEVAKRMLESGVFNDSFSAADKRSMMRTTDRRIKVNGVKNQSIELSKSAELLISAGSNDVTMADIEADPLMSDEDKSTAKALLMGDDDMIEKVKYAPEALGIDIRATSEPQVYDEIRKIADRFGRSEKTPEDSAKALSDLNLVKLTAASARQYNANNRGKGLNKSAFKAINKEIAASSEAFYANIKNEKTGFLRGLYDVSGYDIMFDEVNALSSDAETRAELLGYANEVAENMGVDLHGDRKTIGKWEREIKPVVAELKRLKRKTLGLSMDDPNTDIVATGGKVALIPMDKSRPAAKAERSVSPKKVNPRGAESADQARKRLLAAGIPEAKIDQYIAAKGLK